MAHTCHGARLRERRYRAYGRNRKRDAITARKTAEMRPSGPAADIRRFVGRTLVVGNAKEGNGPQRERESPRPRHHVDRPRAHVRHHSRRVRREDGFHDGQKKGFEGFVRMIRDDTVRRKRGRRRTALRTCRLSQRRDNQTQRYFAASPGAKAATSRYGNGN